MEGLRYVCAGADNDGGRNGRVLFGDFRRRQGRDGSNLPGRAIYARNEHDERASEMSRRTACPVE